MAIGLGQGFTRSARAADLPDLIVRFDPQPLQRVAARIRALPDIAAFSTRAEFTGVDIAANGHTRRGRLGRGGRRRTPGLRDRRRARCLLAVRRGRDRARLGPGVGRRPGSAAPDQGARITARGRVRRGPRRRRLPAGGAARLRVAGGDRRPVWTPARIPEVNVAEIWLRDPRYLNEVLVQARTTSYGLRGLRIITRSGRPRAARSGGRDRDRPAGRAVGVRARHRRRDARRVGPGRGAAAAEDDRDQPRGRRFPRAFGHPQAREAAVVAVPPRRSASSRACSPRSARRTGC